MTVVMRVDLVLAYSTEWKTREIHHKLGTQPGVAGGPHCSGLEAPDRQPHRCSFCLLLSCVSVCAHGVCQGRVCRGHDALVGVRGHLLACFFYGGFWRSDSGCQALTARIFPAQSSQWPLVSAAPL